MTMVASCNYTGGCSTTGSKCDCNTLSSKKKKVLEKLVTTDQGCMS